MNYIFIFLMLGGFSLYADLKTVHPEQVQQQLKEQLGQQPSAINVNFSLGNAQEAPAKNTATTTNTTQHVVVEHKVDTPKEESIFKSMLRQATSAASYVVTHVVIEKVCTKENIETAAEIIKKVVFRS